MANLVMLVIFVALVYMFVRRIDLARKGHTPNIDNVLRRNMF
ncbi:hypothetical protein WR164_03720 [Philodulcilactobacillus myokoensis]|uniref:Uncharacterized protein n=1 Tax=Philodulcilactobacillus myokoensis TaxID=2929573 RepID=A0A9W6B0Z4_9LACO|nr:hypothetical protein [Philodulcilactobacillus myokoensis]GLB46393.1 hypothetical protein WR164_03720 [Philodulcilactobacillus myokoensis]